MHKKWGYILGFGALILTAFSAYFSAIGVDFAVGFSALSVLSVLCFVGVYHIVITSLERRTQTILRNRLERLQAELRRMRAESEQSDQAVVNSESATDSEVSNMIETHRDSESGLLSHSFFPVYLDQRITAARRTLRPVSLVIFTLDGLGENDTNAPSDKDFYVSAVGDVVKRTLRESDCGFRIDENTFAAVMDDTTESGAVWAAERVRGVLHTGALAGRVTISAGVACYPSHALEPEELISRATKALKVARERGVDQVEIAADQ